MLSAVKAVHLMHAHAANVRRGFQLPAQVIAPLMVRTANREACITRLRDELHAAMSTHVVKDARLTMLIAHHHQRQGHEYNRVHTAGLADVTTKAEARPGFGNHQIALFQPLAMLNIGLIGQCGAVSHRGVSCPMRAGAARGSDVVRCGHNKRARWKWRDSTPATPAGKSFFSLPQPLSGTREIEHMGRRSRGR